MIEQLELALRLMKERRHEVAGLGAPMAIIKEVIEELKITRELKYNYGKEN